VILLVLALIVAVVPAPSVITGATAPADAYPDVPAPPPARRSRGPPPSPVRLARPTAQCPVLSIRFAVPEQFRSPNDTPSAGPHPTDP